MAQEIPIILGILTFLIGAATLIFKLGSWWNQTRQPDVNCVGRSEFSNLSEKLEKLHIQLLLDIGSLRLEIEKIEGRMNTLLVNVGSLQEQLKRYNNGRPEKS